MALTAAGEWAAGVGLAIAVAFHLSSSPVPAAEGTTVTPASQAASCGDDSTTTEEPSESAAVFLPEDTIVAHRVATTSDGTGAAQMQKPSG
jgi:hypothetical protein